MLNKLLHISQSITKKTLTKSPAGLLLQTILKNEINPLRTAYSNFGHKPEKASLFTKIWYGFLGVSFVICALDYRWLRRVFKKPVKELAPDGTLRRIE